MTARSAQILTAVLTTLLVILVGATVFVVLTRAPVNPTPTPTLFAFDESFPAPSPSASELASPSPSPTPIVLATPSAAAGVPTNPPTVEVPTASEPAATQSPASSSEPTPTPTERPTHAPTPTPSPTPVPPPTPSPTLVPTPTPTPTPMPTIIPSAPSRTITFSNLGVDQGHAAQSIPRVITFTIDGQSLITAQAVSSDNPVQLCLWREAVDDLKQCSHGRNVTIQEPVTDDTYPEWHVSVIGIAGLAATAQVSVQFNANSPSVTLSFFRYQGTNTPTYNGFNAELTTGGNGVMSVQAAFDDGSQGAYDWHLTISTNGSAIYDKDSNGQTATSIDLPSPPLQVGGGTDYQINFYNPDAMANTIPVFLAATITWP